jgi:NADPH-dependent F420 reductase
MGKLAGKANIKGMLYREATQTADLVILSVPYAAHRKILEDIREALQGKILIDVTVPLMPPNLTEVHIPPDGSAAQEACNILGKGVAVCTAFQNIPSKHLLHAGVFEGEVLVTGTSQEARAETLKLIRSIDLTGWDAGPIENSIVIEGLTSVLIHINKVYKSTSAGIRITGVKHQ